MMRNFQSNICPNYARNKIIVISIGIVLNTANAVSSLILGLQNSAAIIAYFILSFAVSFLVFSWCYYDSAERGEPLSGGWKFMLVFLGLITLVFYLFNTRGFTRGLLAMGWLLLIYIGSTMCVAVIMTIIHLITGVR